MNAGVLTDPADVARLNGFMQQMDLNIRLLGADTLAARNVFVRAARYSLATRSDHSEMARLLHGLPSYRAWPGCFGGAGDRALAEADEAAAAGRIATASALYLRAAGLYHVGQINLLSHDSRKAPLQTKASDAYRRGGSFYRWPAQSLTIDTPVGEAFAVYRVPDHDGPCPAVVMINGANSVKEEVHYFADFMLERGIATLVLEAPGQGEAGFVRRGERLRIDTFGIALSAAVDWVEKRPEVDRDRLALWGLSWGGFLSLRWFADLPQVRTAVSLGGFYDLRKIDELSPWLLEEFCTLLGCGTFDEVRAYIRADASLATHLDGVGRPYLVVHGALDDLLDEEEVHDMAAAPGGELWIYPDGVHCCYNRGPEVGMRIADWLVERLGVSRA